MNSEKQEITLFDYCCMMLLIFVVYLALIVGSVEQVPDFYCVNEEYIHYKIGSPFCGHVMETSDNLVKLSFFSDESEPTWISKSWLKKFDVSPYRFFDGQPKEYQDYLENVIFPAEEDYRKYKLELKEAQKFYELKEKWVDDPIKSAYDICMGSCLSEIEIYEWNNSQWFITWSYNNEEYCSAECFSKDRGNSTWTTPDDECKLCKVHVNGNLGYYECCDKKLEKEEGKE